MKNTTKNNINELLSDNGLEYWNDESEVYLKSNAILFTHSTPESPW